MGTRIDNDKQELAAVLRAGELDAKGKGGETKLMHFASKKTWLYEKKLGPKACVDHVRQLLAAGADFEIKDQHGWTALVHAIRNAGAPEVVTYLLECGADPNVVAKNGLTPLHHAVERGAVPIVRQLLLAGARPDVDAPFVGTPLQLAKKADLRALLEAAASGRLTAKTKPATPVRGKPPAALTAVLAKHRRARLANLPGYARDATLEVVFFKKPTLAPFHDNDIDPLAYPTYFPLAQLAGEAQFLVVDAAKTALPVLLWEHEDGRFAKVAPSLTALVGRLRPII